MLYASPPSTATPTFVMGTPASSNVASGRTVPTTTYESPSAVSAMTSASVLVRPPSATRPEHGARRPEHELDVIGNAHRARVTIAELRDDRAGTRRLVDHVVTIGVGGDLAQLAITAMQPEQRDHAARRPR